jgi:hypothetical protein
LPAARLSVVGTLTVPPPIQQRDGNREANHVSDSIRKPRPEEGLAGLFAFRTVLRRRQINIHEQRQTSL